MAAVVPPPGAVSRFRRAISLSNRVIGALAQLVGTNVASRIITATSVFLSAMLFAPAEFARFGALLAALTFASAVQFLRYDSVIVSSGSAAGQRAALRLAAVVGVAVWLLAACIALRAVQGGLVGQDIALIFIVALAGRGMCRYLGRIAIRHGDFRAFGNASLVMAAAQPLVVVLAWMSGAGGAMAMGLSDIIGNAAAAGYLGWRFRSHLRDACRIRAGDPSIFGLAREWASLPLINLPSTACAAAFAALPLLAIIHLADANIAGHVALAFRLLDAPVQVLAGSVAPIAMNRFVVRQASALQQRDVALVSWLTLAVLILFGGASIAALMLDPWLMKTQWAGLGLVLPFVALFQAGNAFALPLIEVADLKREQRHLLAVQALALLAICIIAALSADWRMALLGFGLVALVRGASLAAPLVIARSARATV
ncbi:MAG: hypothetical protein ACRCWO_06355 [Bosea sp. (in: a-proteobacteria)]